MEAIQRVDASSSIYEQDTESIEELRNALRGIQRYGISYAEISKETGVNRTAISLLVNQGKVTTYQNLDRIRLYVKSHYEARADQQVDPLISRQSIGLWQTEDYVSAMGWMTFLETKRKMGVLIGAPGTGKTTVLRRFAEDHPGCIYIEAMPNMRVKDLILTIAAELGIGKIKGNCYQQFQTLLEALRGRDDVMILVDEAEYLKKWDVDKFEYLRKIWDNTGTPVVLCGTQELEQILTRGAGKENLAQLYRRKYELQLNGISAKAALQHLRQYNLTTDAAEILAKVGADVGHGGLGNMVEILELCIETAAGGTITGEMVKAAKRHKLMY